MSVLTKYNSANINQLMDRLQKNTIGMDDYFDRVFGVEGSCKLSSIQPGPS